VTELAYEHWHRMLFCPLPGRRRAAYPSGAPCSAKPGGLRGSGPGRGAGQRFTGQQLGPGCPLCFGYTAADFPGRQPQPYGASGTGRAAGP
jgi:hypothetical protein